MTSGLERLWAPWRMEYIGSASNEEEQGCIFCELRAKNDDEATLILARQEYSFAILNKFPYNSGHLMVAPFRHVGNLADLKDDESLDVARLLGRCVEALKEAMQPEGFNVGLNLGRVAGAGILDHVHWHVVPRWSGDTNFMPVLGDTKVLPELLKRTYEKLQPSFARTR